MSSDIEPIASMNYQPGDVAGALEFLKRTRNELRQLRLARVWRDRFAVLDVNQDCFEIRGIGYPDADIVALLDHVNAAYKRELIHHDTTEPYKEFKTGRRYAWAADRVM